MLVDKEDIMLEASVEMRFEPKLHDDRIMVTVNVGIYPIQSLKELANQGGKSFRKWNT